MTFDIEFGDCDESVHPHCEGLTSETVLLVAGFKTQERAEEYARDILYDRYTVATLLRGPGEGLTSETMMTEDRDPARVIIRDYNVTDNSQPCGEQDYTVVAGGHDEFSLEDTPEELAELRATVEAMAANSARPATPFLPAGTRHTHTDHPTTRGGIGRGLARG